MILKNTSNDVVSEISFDIDDQSPEDLALSLDLIAKNNGVLDIIQNPKFGKKRRIIINVIILVKVEKSKEIIELIPTHSCNLPNVLLRKNYHDKVELL